MTTLARLFQVLAPFSPTLAGTVPLGIQVAGSDLDILCHAPDLTAFEDALRQALAGVEGSAIERAATEPPAVLGRCEVSGFPVEVFGQPLPVAEQAAFQHMVLEGRLLSLGGTALRAAVIERKRNGLKTEPAFADLLGLAGDPYQGLLELRGWSDDQLADLLSKVGQL